MKGLDNDTLVTLQSRFVLGRLDTIIYNTINPANSARSWSFVRDLVAANTAEAAAKQAAELEAEAREKEAKAQSMEASAVHEKKDGGFQEAVLFSGMTA